MIVIRDVSILCPFLSWRLPAFAIRVIYQCLLRALCLPTFISYITKGLHTLYHFPSKDNNVLHYIPSFRLVHVTEYNPNPLRKCLEHIRECLVDLKFSPEIRAIQENFDWLGVPSLLLKHPYTSHCGISAVSNNVIKSYIVVFFIKINLWFLFLYKVHKLHGKMDIQWDTYTAVI